MYEDYFVLENNQEVSFFKVHLQSQLRRRFKEERLSLASQFEY